MNHPLNLAYISSLKQQASGGGSYAVNWHAYDQLSRAFRLDYVGPLEPEVPVWEEWNSKLRRKLFKVPGRFSFFSETVLHRTAKTLDRLMPGKVDGVFYRSATPWCHHHPACPYFVYLDVVFHTFFHNTFRPGDFIADDLERIWKQEAVFLEGAAAVFFESRWGMERAIEVYQLNGDHYHALGRGGVIAPPERDGWDGELRLVTMAMKFRQKGGDLVLEVFRRLKPRYPELSWHIIGGAPEGDWEGIDGIHYEGVLRPDFADERTKIEQLLTGAFLLLHPTREDTSPLVLTEAAYFGCPSISVRHFAIPELVIDGQTGVLIDFPATADQLEQALVRLLEDRQLYLGMREQARHHAMRESSWDSIGTRMSEIMHRHLSERSGLA